MLKRIIIVILLSVASVFGVISAVDIPRLSSTIDSYSPDVFKAPLGKPWSDVVLSMPVSYSPSVDYLRYEQDSGGVKQPPHPVSGILLALSGVHRDNR